MNPKRLVKKLLPTSLFYAIEPYGHLVEAAAYQIAAGFPARGLKVIGVTGTNGKTTTSFMIYHILRAAGIKVGLMTTVAYGIGDDLQPPYHHMTTVPVPHLVSQLKRMRGEGVEWVVLETTSHALAQHRVWGIPYSVAVMTNLSHEHLDYHRTFERYRAAKVRLFELAGRNRKGLQTGIVNMEDPSWEYFAKPVPKTVSYGLRKGDWHAGQLQLSPSGSDFVAINGGQRLKVHINLSGGFNVANALAAVAATKAIGIDDQAIITGLANLQSVEGRMVSINEGQDFSVIVDFAHTPDSFEKVFENMRPLVKGKMIAVFGSPGRRDIAKRAIQGKLAGKYCDEVIVTEDDPYDCDNSEIMDQIAKGAEEQGKVREKDLFIIGDRTEAITFAVAHAKSGDAVLLLGKGHEKVIERAHGADPWDEVDTVRKAIRTRLAR